MRRVLDEARIPFHSGLLAGRPPQVVFSVPREQVERARRLLGRSQIPPPEPGPSSALETFPWRSVLIAGALVVFHMALVFWMNGPLPPGRELLHLGGLVRGETLGQPWRLLTSIFLHVDMSHALWNGVSLVVFAVPLLTDLGFARTVLIYLAAGVGGGLAALGFGSAGTTVVGSSGAVAGLFGAWVVVTLRFARRAVLTRRARIRTLGIALLVLPSLLSPMTASGQPISVSSHMGGLLTGMLIGAVISGSMLAGAWEATEPST